MPQRGSPGRHPMYALWYFAIAAGFLLLAVHFLLRGGRVWLIVLRLAIAAGFSYLGWREWRTGGKGVAKRPPQGRDGA